VSDTAISDELDAEIGVWMDKIGEAWQEGEEPLRQLLLQYADWLTDVAVLHQFSAATREFAEAIGRHTWVDPYAFLLRRRAVLTFEVPVVAWLAWAIFRRQRRNERLSRYHRRYWTKSMDGCSEIQQQAWNTILLAIHHVETKRP